jgi:hypothetical protein
MFPAALRRKSAALLCGRGICCVARNHAGREVERITFCAGGNVVTRMESVSVKHEDGTIDASAHTWGAIR